ncbi:hypothetical protein HELRODRAFT_179071 [Helobdella robusta]|uniref:Uncharacterized protein n=1 Tax=Helobdella robusta TaxID=6412 RepID=T1FE52_HELRO|nr:hypothetical protein HELRODRAFT_179071 [Helobdella robusta]ESN95617.1 hypothetical protein HELRODRAFT_179071 [Helobdella robusta]
MNAEKSEPMEIASCVRNYTNEYRIQQRTLGRQIAQETKEGGGFVFTESKACFHWACRSAFAQPWPVFTGPSSLVGFRTTKGLFSLGLSANLMESFTKVSRSQLSDKFSLTSSSSDQLSWQGVGVWVPNTDANKSLVKYLPNRSFNLITSVFIKCNPTRMSELKAAEFQIGILSNV